MCASPVSNQNPDQPTFQQKAKDVVLKGTVYTVGMVSIACLKIMKFIFSRFDWAPLQSLSLKIDPAVGWIHQKMTDFSKKAKVDTTKEPSKQSSFSTAAKISGVVVVSAIAIGVLYQTDTFYKAYKWLQSLNDPPSEKIYSCLKKIGHPQDIEQAKAIAACSGRVFSQQDSEENLSSAKSALRFARRILKDGEKYDLGMQHSINAATKILTDSVESAEETIIKQKPLPKFWETIDPTNFFAFAPPVVNTCDLSDHPLFKQHAYEWLSMQKAYEWLYGVKNYALVTLDYWPSQKGA